MPVFLEFSAAWIFGVSGFALFAMPPAEPERHAFRPQAIRNLVQHCTLLHAAGEIWP
jgi:hypothetical protein